MDTKSELQRPQSRHRPQRDIEKLQVLVDQRQSGADAGDGSRESAVIRVSTLLPAERRVPRRAGAGAGRNSTKPLFVPGVDGASSSSWFAPATSSIN